MNDLATMHSANTNNDPTPKEVYKIDGVFVVERRRSINDKDIEVFSDELFKNGVSVLVVHSMETKPEDVVSKYLKMEQEKAESIARQKAYKESAYTEKCGYWQVYAQKSIAYGPRFSGSSIINIAELRAKEPEINLFLDAMVRAVARLYDMSYEETLQEHFQIDDLGKDYIRTSKIDGVDMDFEVLAEKIGNLFYDALGVLVNSVKGELMGQSLKKQEVGETEVVQNLTQASNHIGQAVKHIMNAWGISRPFVGEGFPNFKHSSEIQELGISKSELGKRVAKLSFERLSELLSLLSIKISKDGDADSTRGRQKLSNELHMAAQELAKASEILKGA